LSKIHHTWKLVINLVEGVCISLRLVAGGRFCYIVVNKGNSNDSLSKVNKSRKKDIAYFIISYKQRRLAKYMYSSKVWQKLYLIKNIIIILRLENPLTIWLYLYNILKQLNDNTFLAKHIRQNWYNKLQKVGISYQNLSNIAVNMKTYILINVPSIVSVLKTSMRVFSFH
jgi:hypothetical protein